MRIASLNALSDPEYRRERVTQMFVEAADQNVDVLCLQEVPREMHAEIRGIARAHRYAWQHLVSGVPGDEVGTFSRVPVEDAGTFTVAHPDGGVGEVPIGQPYAQRTFAWVRLQGFLIINVHLTWGAHNEPARLREVAAIEAFAADAVRAGAAPTGEGPARGVAARDGVLANPAGSAGPSAVSAELVPVLAGDVNAEPDNDCVRFLRGKTPIDGVGTYWTEATLGTDLQHVPTTRETNQWGQQSARSRGVDASLLHPRRIDFIFARGWRHGGRGTMLGTARFGESVTPEGIELSDHYGWVTDLQE